MFRIVAILALVISIALLILGIMRRRGLSAEERAETVCCPGLSFVDKALYGIMALGLLALTITGLGVTVGLGRHLTGWPLMAHCTAAPAFALGIAGVALTWSDRCRLGKGASCFGAFQNSLFWLMLIFSLVSILSAVLPMMPYFTPHAQENLLTTHRWSSLAVTAIVILHISRLIQPVPVSATVRETAEVA